MHKVIVHRQLQSQTILSFRPLKKIQFKSLTRSLIIRVLEKVMINNKSPTACRWAVICQKLTLIDEVETELRTLCLISRTFRLKRLNILGKSQILVLHQVSLRKAWRSLSQMRNQGSIIQKLPRKATKSNSLSSLCSNIKEAARFSTSRRRKFKMINNLRSCRARRYWSLYLTTLSHIMAPAKTSSSSQWFPRHSKRNWLTIMREITRDTWCAWMRQSRPSRFLNRER